MDRKTLYFFLALFALTLLFKAYYLDKVPFQFDETMYAEMISEEAENITFLPTYLGLWAPWKPGLYFIAYSLFLPITSQLFTSLEWIYRSPNLLFGALNAFLFFLIAKRFLKEETAMAAALLFYSSWASIYVETRLLMEVFMLTTILLSLLFYTDKKMPNLQRFGCAALFAFAAALTKCVIALMIIPLAIAFVFQNDRKNLLNPVFLVSLLAPVAGILLFAFTLSQIGMMEGILFRDTGKFFVYDYGQKTLESLLIGIGFLLAFSALYIVMAWRKLLSSWKTELFFSSWFFLFLVLAFSGEPHPWYFVYIIPPVCFFAASSMEEKGKFDNFSKFLLATIVLFSFAMVIIAGPTPDATKAIYEGKEIGFNLSGKENVLFVGRYYPLATAVSYKTLSERHAKGEFLDFGYVIYQGTYEEDFGDQQDPPAPEVINAVISDYNTSIYPFHTEFAPIFYTYGAFRKETGIEEFDYLVVSPPNTTIESQEYSLEFNGTKTAVYKRK
ncbi:MAG: glycosyltransferase family 39 protein [Candidatus Bilamarchaeaceae archaeon]